MKVISIQHKTSSKAVPTIDCFVDSGYLQGPGGSLPDVDTDFQSDRRQEVKEYIEQRYNHDGKQRVFSAGTFTTLKLKAVLKDVARVHRVPVNIVNYITAIFEDDKMTWTDLFLLAATNKKVHSFIMEYPKVIEDIRTLMGQPRSSSIHASALLVTPDTKDGKDMEARTHVAFGNTLSGVVMCLTLITSEHALEHALSAYHPALPHGAGLIMVSKAYYKYFIEHHACDDRFIRMAQAMGMPEATKPEDFLTALTCLQEACGVADLKMSDYGITPDEFETLMRNTREVMGVMFTSDRVQMTDEDIVNVYKESYK